MAADNLIIYELANARHGIVARTNNCMDDGEPQHSLCYVEGIEHQEHQGNNLMECAAAQLEEVDALAAILGDDRVFLIDTDTKNKTGTLPVENCKATQSGTRFEFQVHLEVLENVAPEYFLSIEMYLPPTYPHCVPTIKNLQSNSGVLSSSMEDKLCLDLISQASKLLGEQMVYCLYETAKEFLVNKILNVDVQMKLNSSLEFYRDEAKVLRKALCPDLAFDSVNDASSIPKDSTPILVEFEDFATTDEMEVKVAIDEKKKESDLESIDPATYVGSIYEILKLLPDNLPVVRVENVLNFEVAKAYKDHLSKKGFSSSRKCTVFHGTQNRNMKSIIANGLKSDVPIANGRAYGHGIYVSQEPTFSLGYSDDNKIFVCAAVDVRWHIDKQIGTVLDQRNILPVYVIHIGDRSSSFLRASRSGMLYAVDYFNINPYQNNGSGVQTELTMQEQAMLHAKEAAIANAAHYFDTTRYQVLEVADYSDDDDYCQYVQGEIRTLRQGEFGVSVDDYHEPGEAMEIQRARLATPGKVRFDEPPQSTNDQVYSPIPPIATTQQSSSGKACKKSAPLGPYLNASLLPKRVKKKKRSNNKR